MYMHAGIAYIAFLAPLDMFFSCTISLVQKLNCFIDVTAAFAGWLNTPITTLFRTVIEPFGVQIYFQWC